MRKSVWTIVLLLGVIIQGFSQNSFLAVANGAWNGSGVWSLDGVTPITCGPCVAGTDFPSGIDQAYTQGFSITIPANTNFSVGDLFVAYNITNGITRPNLGLACSLTIKGELSAYDPVAFDYATPDRAIIRNDNANLVLIFDGANGVDPVINVWGPLAPLRVVRFNPASPATTLSISGLSLSNSGTLTVLNGTLQVDGPVQAAGANGTITVNTGTTLRVNSGTISGNGSSSTLFPTIVVNGTLISANNATAYINSNNFTLAASAALNIGYTAANPGWWHASAAAPTNLTLDPASTVTYNANAAQAVYATSYGNLSLTSSGTATKTLTGSGLGIRGNFVVGTNVTFSPATETEFTGTLTQNVSGAGTLNFNGGIELNKASGSVTLSKSTSIAGVIITAGTLNLASNTSISNGITITSGTLNLGDVATTLSSGNVAVAGTLSSGTSGTFTVSGSSTFSGVGTMLLNNLTTSGTAVINNNAWSITGNLVNSGSLTLPSTSTVTFTGGATQSISGNAFTIGNLTINKTSSTLNNAGTVELLGALTMTTGTFDADGLPAGTGGSGVFTLNSDTNGDARIAPMAGGSIVGNVTFERYFDNTSNRWRNLALPVTGITHTALQTSFPIHTNSLSYYVEATAGNVNQGFVFVNSGTLLSSRGYSAWMYNVAPITISVRGPLLKQTPANAGSPYNFGVTYTNNVPGAPDADDGWNFIPNPFPSAINWSNPGWIKTNVNAAAAIWDIEANIYRYTDAGWNGIIAAGQAFWVQTNGSSPVLTCQESVKTTDSDPVFYREAAPKDKLLVTLKSSVYEDIAAIRFREDATTEFDTQYDASKLQNPIFNLSSVTREGLSLAVNNLPKGACASAVPLNITNIEPGTYSLKFEGLGSFDGLESVTLIDHFAKTSTVLTDRSTHSFEVSGETASYGSGRFELSFKFADSEVQNVVISRDEQTLTSNYEEGVYQWFLNDTKIEGATASSFVAKTNGTYALEVTYKGCPVRSENITVEGLSRVYPNPVSGDLKISVSDLVPDGLSEGEIVITSTLGAAVKNVSFNGNDLIKVIDMRDVRPGQYIVSISSKSKVVERVKLIVQ